MLNRPALPFHPKKLIQNIYGDKIKRVRVVLTNYSFSRC